MVKIKYLGNITVNGHWSPDINPLQVRAIRGETCKTTCSILKLGLNWSLLNSTEHHRLEFHKNHSMNNSDSSSRCKILQISLRKYFPLCREHESRSWLVTLLSDNFIRNNDTVTHEVPAIIWWERLIPNGNYDHLFYWWLSFI